MTLFFSFFHGCVLILKFICLFTIFAPSAMKTLHGNQTCSCAFTILKISFQLLLYKTRLLGCKNTSRCALCNSKIRYMSGFGSCQSLYLNAEVNSSFFFFFFCQCALYSASESFQYCIYFCLQIQQHFRVYSFFQCALQQFLSDKYDCLLMEC